MRTTLLTILTLGLAATLAAVEPGQPAPDFTLSDQNGNTVTLSELDGAIRVLEWTNPECPFVKRHYAAGTMKTLAAKYADDGVVWLTINSSHHQDREVNAAFAKQHELAVAVLTDQDGAVGRAYGAKTTPHLFIVDGDGVVVYAGGIDDDPRGSSDSPTGYVDLALAALVAGKPVPTPETVPYGCSVKYAKR
jgi:peroxiredoxin